MKLIVGLGNPGIEYVDTRHNVGFAVVDLIAGTRRVRVNQWKYESLLGVCRLAGEEVVLLKPQTFMNLSGRAVYQAVKALGVNLADLLIIHDDLDLPPGRLRLRLHGSPGGHNGMKSILSCLGTDQFARLRLGIGRPEPGTDAADYVLRRFAKEEQTLIDRAVARAGDAVYCLTTEGMAAAMGIYNRPEAAEAEPKE